MIDRFLVNVIFRTTQNEWEYEAYKECFNMSMEINVVEYQEEWHHQFVKEKEALEECLGDVVIETLHIGSTSVAGLKAKPIIDILLVVERITDLDELTREFEVLGYVCRGELGIPGRRYFAKGGYYRTHQIHAFQYDNVYEIQRHLSVRDYLRTHPEVAEAYGEIKAQAAEKFPTDIEGYGDEKELFVLNMEKEALKWTWQNSQ